MSPIFTLVRTFGHAPVDNLEEGCKKKRYTNTSLIGEYHAVNQIVTKSLHTSDDDCFAYTKSLIERLEATKVERADDDAIIDNAAGQAYVEQFAQETFGRAERTMRANKVTRCACSTLTPLEFYIQLIYISCPYFVLA